MHIFNHFLYIAPVAKQIEMKCTMQTNLSRIAEVKSFDLNLFLVEGDKYENQDFI